MTGLSSAVGRRSRPLQDVVVEHIDCGLLGRMWRDTHETDMKKGDGWSPKWSAVSILSAENYIRPGMLMPPVIAPIF